MKKLSFAAALGIGTMFTTSAWAADCVKADCASLGYTLSLPTNCLESINCPFDTAYKACTHLENDLLDSCPSGKTCTKKYKVTEEDSSCSHFGSNYKKTLAECGTDSHGSYSLGTTASSDPSCKQCVLTCNTGYTTAPEYTYTSCTLCPTILTTVFNPYCNGYCHLLGGTNGTSLTPNEDKINFLTTDVTLNATISNEHSSNSGTFENMTTAPAGGPFSISTCGFTQNPELTLNTLTAEGTVSLKFEVPVSGTIDISGSGYKNFQFYNKTDVTIKNTKITNGTGIIMELHPNNYSNSGDINLIFDTCASSSCTATMEASGPVGSNKVTYTIKDSKWKVDCNDRNSIGCTKKN